MSLLVIAYHKRARQKWLLGGAYFNASHLYEKTGVIFPPNSQALFISRENRLFRYGTVHSTGNLSNELRFRQRAWYLCVEKNNTVIFR